MTRRLTPFVCAAACLFALAGHAQQDRPNIVFLFSDDHAPHAISAYGSVVNETPNIDRIASEGAIFLRSYCGNSICGPSRATILTGLHSHANGFIGNGSTFDGSQTTMPKLLQDAGYTTALIGKWHLRSEPTGFDHWMILPGQGQYYGTEFITPDGRQRFEGHSTNLVTDFGLAWLDEQRANDSDEPFLLMLQFKAPHRNWLPGPDDLPVYAGVEFPVPDTLFDDYANRAEVAAEHEMGIDQHMRLDYDLHLPPSPDGVRAFNRQRMTDEQLAAWNDAFAEENAAVRARWDDMTHEEQVLWKYQRYMRIYLSCIHGVDRNVGRVLDYLDEHGLSDNTLVVYSSDQGFYLGDHGWFDKRWMYEESFQMPLVVRWPGRIQPGTRIESLTQNIDYAPTLLSVAGVQAPDTMHGHNLIPLFTGEPGDIQNRDTLYYHYYEYPQAHRVAPHIGVTDGTNKLVWYYDHDQWELFNLDSDPDELRSVYDDPAYAETQQRLLDELERLRTHYGDDTVNAVPGAREALAD